MDGRRFDDLAKALSAQLDGPMSRRGLLRGLAAAIGGGATFRSGGGVSAAACPPDQVYRNRRTGCVCEVTGRPPEAGSQCPCPTGQVRCSSGCANLTDDEANCGACGVTCGGGQVCRNGVCLKRNGGAALAAAECSSGKLADGVCCDAHCTGQCESCAVPGSVGRCVPVGGAPVGGRAACGGSGACAGSCDGVNRAGCAFPGAATACGAATCSDETGQASVSACDGAGGCRTTTTACGLYRCVGATCGTGCASDGDCVGAAYCSAGVCAADLPDGAICTDRGQCQGGFCAAGICGSAPLPLGSPCTGGADCQSGNCTGGVCGCPLDQKLCDGACIPGLACCVDADCGFDAVCLRAVCNQTTHTCGHAPADSDPRCVSDACTQRVCTGGTCVSTPLVECPVCQGCSGGACAAIASDPRCAGTCANGACGNLPAGGPCTDNSQCSQDLGETFCNNNLDPSDGPLNCCRWAGSYCTNDRECCLNFVCDLTNNACTTR